MSVAFLCSAEVSTSVFNVVREVKTVEAAKYKARIEKLKPEQRIDTVGFSEANNVY